MLKVFDLVLREYLYNKYDIIDRVIIREVNFVLTTVDFNKIYEINIWLKYVDGCNDYDEYAKYDIRDDVRVVMKLINLSGESITCFHFTPSFV